MRRPGVEKVQRSFLGPLGESWYIYASDLGRGLVVVVAEAVARTAFLLQPIPVFDSSIDAQEREPASGRAFSTLPPNHLRYGQNTRLLAPSFIDISHER